MANAARDRRPRAGRVVTCARSSLFDAVDADDPRRIFARLGKGRVVVALSKGAVSFGDCVEALLLRVRPARVTICTWAVAPPEAARLAGWAKTGDITAYRIYLAADFRRKHPAYLAAIRAHCGFDAVIPMLNHAKFALLEGNGRSIVLLSSANLNANNRLEFYVALDDAAVASGLRAMLEEWYPTDAAAAWELDAGMHARYLARWRAGEGRTGTWSRPALAPAGEPAAVGPVAAEDLRYVEDRPLGVDVRRGGLSFLK